ncbi:MULTISPECIES: DUF4190 domain-containing protein [unclassified Nocardia]|uniref:DUF4190 domain-containing protein n=1 Tax=unclassified Nocardia TaxID=2637762 RepID=UPI001CE49695|nr:MULTISPECIES: DUF4190 domain-containing protein [unclassified Nocardia]
MSNSYGTNHPRTTTVLVLGILSLVLCQLLGPVAWIMGKNALKEIDASGGGIGGRGNVKVGYICGIIATVLLVIGIVAGIIVNVAGGSSETAAAFAA